jgi:hypothetical protein
MITVFFLTNMALILDKTVKFLIDGVHITVELRDLLIHLFAKMIILRLDTFNLRNNVELNIVFNRIGDSVPAVFVHSLCNVIRKLLLSNND